VLKRVDKSGEKAGNDTYLALCNTGAQQWQEGSEGVISKIQHGHLHVPIHTILYCTVHCNHDWRLCTKSTDYTLATPPNYVMLCLFVAGLNIKYYDDA
jgi:hypothetical protein